ncbi:MAG: hypothetical protein JWM16_4617, partial [Verrucomicrobiales bacterium]|nr:hypothetical protein [Verrucomicrobiales bacterium]
MFAPAFIAVTTAEQSGRISGGVICVLITLIGVLKCFRIIRRPQTNTKCVLALAFLLSGFAVSGVATLIRQHWPSLLPFTGLLLYIPPGFGVAAIALAIIGLVEYSKAKGQYNQGRSQAIWTLALLLGGICLAVLMSAFGSRGVSQGKPSDGRPIIVEEFNFQVTPPGRPWVVIEPAKLNRVAKVALTRAAPSVFFVVISEKIVLPDFTSDSLADAVSVQLSSVAESSKVLQRAAVKSRYLNGVGMQTEAVLQGRDFFYVHYCIATNGWAYQLISWGEKRESAEVLRGASEMLGRFELLNYEARPVIPGALKNEDYVSLNFYYLFRMKDSPWRTLKKRDFPIATFGAAHREDAAVVLATPIFEQEPPELEVVHNIYMKAAGLDPQSAKVLGGGRVTCDGLEGKETLLLMEQTDKNLLYSARTFRGSGIDYFICAWAYEKNPQAKVLLADAMQRVRIFKPSSKRTSSDLAPDERKAQALMMNAIGLHYFEERQFDKCLAYFRSAFELE